MYDLLRPLLFRMDAERAHHAGMWSARLVQALSPALLDRWFAYEDAALHQTLWGMNFHNPVGLAAGFDKNARLVQFWEHLGFGFTEVGSVSAQPAGGNPKPRAFRLPKDEAVINRMGLNNQGAARIARRLQQTTHRRPLGINLVKTHDSSIMGEAGLADFRTSFRQLAPLADYVTLNISCPNTQAGKTFEAPDALDALLRTIFAERREQGLDVPILLKLAPPHSPRVAYDSQIEGVVDVGSAHGVHGYIATNTAPDRPEGLRTDAERLAAIGRGGLSGKPLAERATHLVRYLYRLTDGAVPIIGVGGVASAEDAYAKIRAGASLVQLYTGLVYEGPGLIKRIKQGLVERLTADGLGIIQEAVGADA